MGLLLQPTLISHASYIGNIICYVQPKQSPYLTPAGPTNEPDGAKHLHPYVGQPNCSAYTHTNPTWACYLDFMFQCEWVCVCLCVCLCPYCTFAHGDERDCRSGRFYPSQKRPLKKKSSLKVFSVIITSQPPEGAKTQIITVLIKASVYGVRECVWLIM